MTLATDFLTSLYDIVLSGDDLDVASFVHESLEPILYKDAQSWVDLLNGPSQDVDLSEMDAIYKYADISRLSSQACFGLVCATWRADNREERMPHRAAFVQKCIAKHALEDGADDAQKTYGTIA